VAPAASASELVARIEPALSAGGLQPARATIAGRETVVGGTSKFKWWWITRLKSFLYVAAFQPGSATSGVLDEYLGAARWDAIKKKRDMRGLELAAVGITVVAAMTVAVIDYATPQDEAWAAKPHGSRIGAITFPVLANPAAGNVIRPDRMIVGALFTGYLQGLVRQYVEGPLRG
jgi:hypothetical protein